MDFFCWSRLIEYVIGFRIDNVLLGGDPISLNGYLSATRCENTLHMY